MCQLHSMSVLSRDSPMPKHATCVCKVLCYIVHVHYITMSCTYATADSVHNQEMHKNPPEPFPLAEGGVWEKDYIATRPTIGPVVAGTFRSKQCQ